MFLLVALDMPAADVTNLLCRHCNKCKPAFSGSDVRVLGTGQLSAKSHSPNFVSNMKLKGKQKREGAIIVGFEVTVCVSTPHNT